MLVRDSYGIIVQHPSMDGGDSSARMGISALKNDEPLNLFCEKATGLLVRHPYQAEWNCSKKTSRDQLVQFCVSGDPATKEVASRYCGKWFINKDYLSPAVKLYLYKISGRKIPRLINLLGSAEMLLSLVWNTKIKPHEEMNQFTCLCIVYGPWFSRMFLKMHPDISGNIMTYWKNWRDQVEIAHILIAALRLKANPHQHILQSHY